MTVFVDINYEDRETPDRSEVQAVHDRLVRYLGDHDTFWPIWTYFAEQHGVRL